MTRTEKLKNKSVKSKQNGGARANAGRKKGSENADTKERRIALERFKSRVAKKIDKIFNAQADLALGTSHLFRIDTIGEGEKSKKVHTLVTDPDEIKSFLDGEFENGQDYYYITTKSPNNLALESLLNRTFGRPKETIEIEDSSPKRIIMEVIDTRDESNERLQEDKGSNQPAVENNS